LRFLRTLLLALRIVAELWGLNHVRWALGRRYGAAASRLYTRQARRFVGFAQRMGGLTIKVGQFLSVRIDLLPQEYITALAELQDALPAVPTRQIVAVIEKELKRPLRQIFATFDDTALAAASLGQVHRATLPDGTAVVVKVLRPGIEELVATDLKTLRVLLRLLDKLIDLGRYVEVAGLEADFTATFSDELDYVTEAQHAETFQRNLLLNPYVDIPQIYWERSTRRVLTMEYMPGIRIDDVAGLDAAGVDRGQLAQRLAGLFFHMVLQDGFFHADPHPGNVFVRPDGVIQLIDFGMTGTVTPQARADYASLVLGLVRRDAPAIVRAMRQLGFLGPGADVHRLTELIGPYIDTIVGDVAGLYTGRSILDSMMSGTTQLKIDAGTLAQLQEFIFTQPIVLPGQTTFLGKALITVIGLCLRLDPGLDLLATAAPYVTQGTDLMSWLTQVVGDGRRLGADLLPAGRRLIGALRDLDDGTMEANLSQLIDRRIEAAQRRQTKYLTRVIVLVAGVLAVLIRRSRH